VNIELGTPVGAAENERFSAVVQRNAGVTIVALATLPTLAIAALVPVLPRLFERFHDEPRAQWLVPMILTIPSLCIAIFSSPVGTIVDRWGRRRVLLPALVAFATFGLAPFLVDSLYAILATRFVVGLAESAIITVGNSLLGDYYDEQERRIWLGRQTIVGPLAAFVYVFLGGVLGSASWRAPFLLYLAGFVLLVPSIWTLPEPPRAPVERLGQSLATFPWAIAAQVGGVTVLVSIIFFVQGVQHGRIFSDLGAPDPTHISWAINAAGTGSVLAGLIYRYLPPRRVTTYLAIIFAVFGAGYLGLAAVSNYLVAIPFDFLGQIGCGLSIPVLVGWTLRSFPLEHRGQAMGVWAACFFAGEFASPPALTLIAHNRWSFLHAVGVLGAVCLVFAAVSLAVGRREHPGTSAGVPAPGH